MDGTVCSAETCLRTDSTLIMMMIGPNIGTLLSLVELTGILQT